MVVCVRAEVMYTMWVLAYLLGIEFKFKSGEFDEISRFTGNSLLQATPKRVKSKDSL